MAMRVCAEPGCPAVIPKSQTRCTKCEEEYQRARGARYDANRPSPAARGYDERHREWRKRILERDPLCRCGCGERSTVADHIIPIREGGSRFSMKNGQGMAESCHNRKRAQESLRARTRGD